MRDPRSTIVVIVTRHGRLKSTNLHVTRIDEITSDNECIKHTYLHVMSVFLSLVICRMMCSNVNEFVYVKNMFTDL